MSLSRFISCFIPACTHCISPVLIIVRIQCSGKMPVAAACRGVTIRGSVLVFAVVTFSIVSSINKYNDNETCASLRTIFAIIIKSRFKIPGIGFAACFSAPEKTAADGLADIFVDALPGLLCAFLYRSIAQIIGAVSGFVLVFPAPGKSSGKIVTACYYFRYLASSADTVLPPLPSANSVA